MSDHDSDRETLEPEEDDSDDTVNMDDKPSSTINQE